MSAHGMHPKFNDLDSYKAWLSTWRKLYKEASRDIRKTKHDLKQMQRTQPMAAETAQKQRQLLTKRVMAHKMMTLHKDAKIRWQRILDMQRQMDEQNASFPLDLGKCPVIDFHFNKIAIEFPWMPVWTLKTKGKTFYLPHVDFRNVSLSTRETPDHPATKGSLRFRHCYLVIDKDGTAIMSQVAHEENVAA